MRFQQAIEGAQFNAQRDGKPRYVGAYINDWRVEHEPFGQTCRRVNPDGSIDMMHRDDTGNWEV